MYLGSGFGLSARRTASSELTCSEGSSVGVGGSVGVDVAVGESVAVACACVAVGMTGACGEQALAVNPRTRNRVIKANLLETDLI
jgi:hypothetical protein